MEHELSPSSGKNSADSSDRAPASLNDREAAELRQILHTSATSITRCSRDLRYLSVNPAFAKLVGRPAEEIIGRTIITVIGAEAFEVIRPYVERVLRGERVEWEAEIPVACGGSRFVHAIYTPWIEHDGRVAGWVGSISDITDLKRATMVLRDREQALRLALDASGGGSWTWDARTGRVDWDDRFRQIYGFTAEAPPSPDAWPRRLHEDDRQGVLSVLNEILYVKKKNSWDNTFRIVHPDGSVFWIQSRGHADRDINGEVVRLTGIDMDVTERRRAEEALTDREQRLRLALDASAAGVWTWDRFSNQSSWDDRLHAQYGFEPGAPRTFDTWVSSIHEEDRAKVLAHLDDVLLRHQNEWNIVYRVVRRNGTIVWMHNIGRADRGPDGRVMRMNGINLDITGRRQAEEALQTRRDEERDRTLQLLLETAPLGILSIDSRGVIVTANRALEQMFGWPPGELIGQSVDQLLTPAFQSRHAAHRAKYFATPRPRHMAGSLDLVGQRKDGSTFSLEITLNHVSTADGGRAIAFVTDISERKRDQAALQRSHGELEQRTLQLRRLASQLTLAEQTARRQLSRTLHDGLQQLLFSAGMTLDEVMKTDSEEDRIELLDRARADLKEAVEAARTLSVSLFPPVLHVGGLPVALSWLAKRTQEQYGVVVNVSADPQANPAASDVRILLFEAVRELLFNAVKHAGTDQVDVKLAIGDGDTIHIQVSDDGMGFDPSAGIDDKNQPQAGLGLFSIHERLALLGGYLDIQSAPGKGSRFNLILPRSLPNVAADGPEAQRRETAWQERLVYDSASGTPKSLRILIADDHAVARAGLRELFGKRSVLRVVGEAASGVEAISQAVALQPDVIVMDVSMPQMNGIDATREIHRTMQHIRIVGLSTHDDESTERLMRTAGADAYFTKNEGTDRLLDYLLALPAQTKGSSAD
jgi:PAS domain S-box-containing protein